jgi:hypothetical protein
VGQRYLYRVVAAADGLRVAKFKSLSKSALNWVSAAIDASHAGKKLPDFPIDRVVPKYKPRSVDVNFKEDRRSSWKWGGRTILGVENLYRVIDRNFGRLNRWEFTVRVPSKPGQIVVQPQTVPGKRVFADLQRRSIVFVKAKMMPPGRLYCKVHLADPSGRKNYLGTRRGERSRLPPWFDYFRPIMRLKKTVTTTAGLDGKAQVVTVAHDEHDLMIRIFFAMRVWVLQENFTIN